MKTIDITCLGELLIDFTPHGVSDTGMRLFERNAGGAPGNVAAALARLGHSTAFVGNVGCDGNGRFLITVMEQADVDTSCLKSDPDASTSMAFVDLSPNGEREFSFVRDADTKLQIGEAEAELIKNSKIFHFGSLSMTHQPALTATLSALNTAKKAGCIVSYDPNYRAMLWKDEKMAIDRMSSVLKYVDVLKVSEEEAQLLTGEANPEKSGMLLVSQGISLVAVTMGSKGAVICLPSVSIRTNAHVCKAIDTTGAGDAFMGAMLSRILALDIHPGDVTTELALEISCFAHSAAACAVSKRGGIPSMPTYQEVIDNGGMNI